MLFKQKAVAGSRPDEFLVEDLLGAGVGGADEVSRTFERDLKLLDLAEVAREAAARFSRGADHHVHQG
jgi:hypothetical protein